MNDIIKFNYISEESKSGKKVKKLLSNNDLGDMNKGSIIYVAILRDEIVGLALLDANPFHPKAYHLRIYVIPPFRRRGIGSRLVTDLADDSRRFFRVGIDNGNYELTQFFLSLGFTKEISCYLPKYQKADLKGLESITKYNILSMDQLSKLEMDEVKKLLHCNYIKNHYYNPIDENITFTQFCSVAMKGYDQKNSFVIINKPKIVGYLIAYPVDETSIEIGYIGRDYSFNDTIDGEFNTIINKLFSKYKTLYFEIDNVNRQGMDVLNMFKNIPRNSWDVYFNRKNNS